MILTAPHKITHVAIVGTGVIGAGWAALFLARGLRVHAIDPAPAAQEKLQQTIQSMWPSLLELKHTIRLEPPLDRLSFSTAPDAALGSVQLVQENAPENLVLKQQILTRVEEWLPEDAIIASSTSALLIGDIQAKAQNPHRFLAAHPFNPPHILPLVEISGGAKTRPELLDWAMEFYRWLGKAPVRLSRQIEGHIAGRLGAAMWREAISLVEQGVATVSDIDAAVRNGPGPRWASTGCHLTYHLGGGEGGIAHYLTHLGASQQRRWDGLGTPNLTHELCEKLIDEVNTATEGRNIATLTEERDHRLINIMRSRD
ncbi:3-hydroxyacyl-CoA dehydrogenase NAD-binding domain-containing protein [Celeribacter halophilus]|uniref:3-hydroxyacyl-CoA dehydrogenase NAD-binding domain-containing protein n=1 Tax=Celeribacter halophilus TaxID=576117 RepID=UPI003A93DBEB